MAVLRVKDENWSRFSQIAIKVTILRQAITKESEVANWLIDMWMKEYTNKELIDLLLEEGKRRNAEL